MCSIEKHEQVSIDIVPNGPVKIINDTKKYLNNISIIVFLCKLHKKAWNGSKSRSGNSKQSNDQLAR